MYQYFDLTNSNNYVVKNLGDVLPNSVPAPGLIGYAADDLQSNDMIGALQNQIMLATSTDGINWTRFEGLDRGHAVVTPRNEYAARFDVETGQPPLECLNDENRIHEEWDIHRSYGSGFPGALVRDGFVELYFTDDSERSECFGGFFNEHFRIRVPLEEINSAQAYRDADAIVGGNRQEAFYGEDIKYSPLFERYFIIGFNSYDSDPDPEVNTIAPGPTVAWSDYHPDASIAPKSANALYNISRFTGELPLGDHPRTANGRGAILGNELGHTLDFPRGVPPHSAFHLYYEAFPTGIADNSFAELDHILVFGFHENSPTISVAGDNIVEGDQTSSRIEFVATLSNSHHIPIRVQYSTQSGSASSGSDYVEQTGFIEFSPGQTEVRVSIEVLSDRIDESNETFHLNLFDPENSAIAIGQATAVIIDDDTVTVAERLVYYHDSYFDGDTLNSAIDPTVSAFRHNQTSTSVNMTGYVHGLNGVVIDIVDLASETVLTSGSFVIRAGRTSNTAQWNIVQSSPAVDLHVGAGANGSDRVVLTWRDGTIVNTWIEITVKADAATGLANDDIFYFGNQIGDVNGDGFTNATDYQIVRTNTKTVLDPAMVDDDFDLNKDGQVNTIDLLVVRDHATILGANLPIITPGNGQPLLNKNDFPSILPERRQIRRRDEVAEALSQLEETTDEMAEITDLAILAEFDESDRFNSARMALKLTRPA